MPKARWNFFTAALVLRLMLDRTRVPEDALMKPGNMWDPGNRGASTGPGLDDPFLKDRRAMGTCISA